MRTGFKNDCQESEKTISSTEDKNKLSQPKYLHTRHEEEKRRRKRRQGSKAKKREEKRTNERKRAEKIEVKSAEDERGMTMKNTVGEEEEEKLSVYCRFLSRWCENHLYLMSRAI